ncbi:DUF805 domain-containing protein [Bartonella sp. B30(2025)]
MRAEYFWFRFIFHIILYSMLVLLDLLYSLYFSERLHFHDFSDFSFVVVFVCLIQLFRMYIDLSMSIRRIHDIGYSGLWVIFSIVFKYIMAGIILFVLLKMFLFKVTVPQALLPFLFLTLLFSSIAFSLFLLFKDGEHKDNKYGEDPRKVLTDQYNQ